MREVDHYAYQRNLPDGEIYLINGWQQQVLGSINGIQLAPNVYRAVSCKRCFGDLSMQAPKTHILPVAAIRRERLMSAEGRIIARRGQQVNPSDIVAESVLRPEHILLDIGLGLGLSPKEADHYIQRRAGDEVGEGDVIAGPVGIGRRVVRAPKTGTVVVAGDGQVLMELDGEFSALKAGYSGVVSDIVGDRGVVIELVGSLVQGGWGNGRINCGLSHL